MAKIEGFLSFNNAMRGWKYHKDYKGGNGCKTKVNRNRKPDKNLLENLKEYRL